MQRCLGLALLAAVLPCSSCNGRVEVTREDRPPAVPAAITPHRAATVVHVVEWPPPERIDHAALERLPPASQAVAGESPIPVLVPGDPASLSDGILLAKEHWYSFYHHDGALTLSVAGKNVAHAYRSVKAALGSQVVRGQPGFVTQNEGVWSATWIEGGVSYSVDLECAAAADARCAEESFLLHVAEGLVYVGGSGVKP